MLISILYIVVSFTGMAWAIAMTYIFTLSTFMYILVLCLVAFNGYHLGKGLISLVRECKRRIEYRHDKRFMWYYRTGLLESAILVEPKIAKDSYLRLLLEEVSK